jgi:hypothetical protein
MADSRSVMQEFRFLDQKRQSGTLTPAEQARHAELRDLVGFEQPAPARGGFDVTAAAAQLRESLLPAGLRSRPVEPVPAPAAVPAAWSPPLKAAPAPAPAAFAEPEPPLAIDPFFDPASLGQEVRPQAWNPEAPGYDPNAPWDEAAWIAAGYDPNATYDWGDGSTPGDGAATVADPLDAPPAEPPLQFGDYDAPGAPVPVLASGAGWLDEGDPPAPPPAAPAFGDYDAMPGGTPLELGEAPLDLQPESELDVGFELASDGSFGEATDPLQLTPWSETEQPFAAERWESAPALDLSAPFEAAVVPLATTRLPAIPPLVTPEEPVELLAFLEPEEQAAPRPEPFFEALPAEVEPAPRALLESEPESISLAEAEPDPVSFTETEPDPVSFAGTELDPVSLGELEQPDEIDIPPEISAAYDLPPVTSPALDFAPPPLSEVAAALGPSTEAVEAEPEIEPVSLAPSGAGRVGGAQRAVVHLLDGRVLRGTLTDADLEAPELELDTGSPGAVEQVATAAIKAIFFMLAPGEQPPVAEGKRVRVTFRDGRQVAGFSSGYREELAGFFMVPADTRTNTARIWVYQAAVKQVSVS